MSETGIGSKEVGTLFERWKEAEKVAMHFNQLITSFRLRALGAASLGGGAFSAIVVTKDEATAEPNRFIMLAVAFVFLLLVWGAVWAVDALYYQCLLHGAVNEAIRLEAASNGALQLSTQIQKQVTAVKARGWFQIVRAPQWFSARTAFYGLPALAFAIVAGASAFVAFCGDSQSTSQAASASAHTRPAGDP